MKRYLLLLISLLLFIPCVVNAETCDNDKIYIDSITLEKSNNVNEIEDATAQGKKVNLNINMTEVGDNIKYKIKLKNDSEEYYLIDNKSINVGSDYLDYSIVFDDNSNIVKAKSSKNIYLTVNYKNKVPDDILSNGSFNDDITMKVNLSTNDLLNPNTGIKYILFISLVLIVSILSFVVYRKKKNSLVILLIGLMIIPLSVKALCKCEIDIVSKVSISTPQIYEFSLDDSGENITIELYKEEMIQNRINYKISDINKCENYFKNLFMDYDFTEESALENSKIVCSGGNEKIQGYSMENFIYELIPENEREAAGLSNVLITPNPNANSKDVVVPDYIMGKPVVSLGTYSFYGKQLTSIVLPKTLKIIDGADDVGALCGNKLTSIDLPDSLEIIGTYALNTNELTEVIIPDNVTFIGGGAFAFNNISHLVLGKKVERIENEAFEDNNISTLTIPESVKYIEPEFAGQVVFDRAFGGNPLRSVIIEGKAFESDFVTYRNSRGTPFTWASDITCIPDNDGNVENGCITWTGEH